MGLFSKKPNVKALLDSALIDYKNGSYSECFEKVCEAAEQKDPRACFCKALLAYNDNVNPSSAPDADEMLALTKIAVDGGYSYAYGFYAYLLHSTDNIDELCTFLNQKSKIKDGVYLSFKASYYFGLYTDDEQADTETTKTTIKEAIQLLSSLDEELKKGKDNQCVEYCLYNPYNKFALNYTYAHAQYTYMTILYCENNWNNRREFMNSFNEIVKYMPIPKEKFNAISLYLTAIFDNYLGMKDLNEAKKTMSLLNDFYSSLDEDYQQSLYSNIEEILEKYEEFYDTEIVELQNRNITYSDGYADNNALSLKNVLSAVASGVSKWANSTTHATSSAYVIDGRSYTRGEMGYLYDNEGFKTDWRVDDYARLYDSNGNELGYFNTNGNFISN